MNDWSSQPANLNLANPKLTDFKAKKVNVHHPLLLLFADQSTDDQDRAQGWPWCRKAHHQDSECRGRGREVGNGCYLCVLAA